MNRKAIVSFVLVVLFLVSVTPAPCELSSTHYSPSTSIEPPATQWNMTYGKGGIDAAYSVWQTTDGGYVIAGYTNSSGAGGYDFWLVKTDASGNMIWNQTYGGNRTERASYVQQTTDGGYVMAGSTYSFGAGGSDFWLVKTDASGNMIWNRTFGGPKDDVGEFVQQTTDGGYVIAGFTRSFGAGGYDFWLVKTDASGNMIWNQTYGGGGNDFAFSAQQTTDGGYVIAGGTNSFGKNGSADFWLVKTDASGNSIWNQTYGGDSDDFAYCVRQTTDGGYVMAGGTKSFGAGGDDFWLVKTDASGNMIWNRAYGGADDDTPCFVQQTTDGGYIIAGGTLSYGNDNGTGDFWLVRTDASGKMIWNQTYGGALDDGAECVRQTTDGGYVVAGYTWSFGAGLADFWLVKVAPEPLPSVTHDVAVTDVTPTKTIVGHDFNASIEVTVMNQGEVAEDFNVIAYANMTFIQTIYVTNVQPGASIAIAFAWNTTGFSYGNYSISAYAGPVSGETDTTDNNYTSSISVHVGVPGDISGPVQGVYDGKCDMRDISYLITHFNSKPNSADWNPNADINNDATINMRDISIAIINFNKHE